MTCSLVRPAALLSTQHIPAARLRSQRTPEFPGAGRGQGPLPRDRESPCRSHWASFCAAWYPPLKLPLVEQIALKHRAISCDEAAPCILGYLFGGAGVVENNLRKHAVRPAANTEIWPGMIVASGRCVARMRWIPNARPCRAMVDRLFSICASNFFRSLSAPVLPFIVNICRKIHRCLAGV